MMELQSRTKVCKRCQRELDSSQFYGQVQRCKTNPEKAWKHLDSCCKTCRLEEISLRTRNFKIQAIAYLGGKCVDCGLVDDPCVYDFHHLDPSQKEIAIGSGYKAKSFENLKSELDKCVLLCAICHRKRHLNKSFKE